MTIAELEKKTGLQRSTIHHYIRCGLLHEPYRTSQTMAYYDESHLHKLEMIQKVKTDFLKTATTSRVPLDFIKNKIDEDYQEPPSQINIRKYPEQKSTEKKSRKKEEIIEIALELYGKKGYYRTNIRDITKKIGISAPTFYHYFPDKRELFVEAIEYVINEWKVKLIAALAQEPDPTKKTIIMFRTFQEHYPKVGEVLNHLRAGVAIGDRWAQIKLKHVYDILTENILKLTKESIEKGTIRDVDPELLSYFFFMIDEAAVQRLALDDRYTTRELMSFVADMIAFGFLTKKGKTQLDKYRETTAQMTNIK
jgi:AcrR family transcriptional regulator